MTRGEYLFDISDLPKDGYKTLHKILSDHDASQRALIEQQASRLEELSKENYTMRHKSREMSEAFHKDVASMKALIEQQAKEIARVTELAKA